jgi:hypothetical protein
MNNLICFLFVSCGISAIWSLSELFTPVRNFVAKRAPKFLRKMLLCMECSSFWIGLLCNFVFFPAITQLSDGKFINLILSGICGGASTLLIIKIANKKNLL